MYINKFEYVNNFSYKSKYLMLTVKKFITK